jgi:hypothetical protein
MSELPKSAGPHDGRLAPLDSEDKSRAAELAAQADLMLARYPIDVREQVSELLRVLAAKPEEAEIRAQ